MTAKPTYLKRIEWSMGGGQCPECCGVPPKWHGNPLFLHSSKIGHELNCELANNLRDAGEEVLFKGEYKSAFEYESYITDCGAHMTRPETPEGCPRLREYNKKGKEEFDNLLFKILSEGSNVKI